MKMQRVFLFLWLTDLTFKCLRTSWVSSSPPALDTDSSILVFSLSSPGSSWGDWIGERTRDDEYDWTTCEILDFRRISFICSTNSFFNELTQDLVRFIIERKILHVTYTNNVTYALINNGPIKNGRHNDVKMMNTAIVAAINATINPIRRKLKTRNLDNASNRW